jgi:glyoxylase-like metal-dependent hydrolase (beta-lactamase superfamily II)
MFSISALPASYGDCLWIEYGPSNAPHVILIDAGPSVPRGLQERLEQLAARHGVLELVVVTHVDADHIGGMLTLLRKKFYGVPVRDFWFNGFRHLPGPEVFGERQGETLTGLLVDNHVAWNVDRKNAGLQIEDGNSSVIPLPGNANIILLSPDAKQLARLKVAWTKVCGDADLYGAVAAETTYFGADGREAFGAAASPNVPALANEEFTEDTAVANGSSIAFIIEYGTTRVLMCGDAFPSRLVASLENLYGAGPHLFDLVKVPHHGSENNVSASFVAALACGRYLFSSNGARYAHPSPQAVARVIQGGGQPELIFNYRTEFNEIWDDDLLKSMHRYTTNFGDASGVTVTLVP